MNKSALEEFEVLKLQMNEFSSIVEGRLAEKRANLINDKQNHSIKLSDYKNQKMKIQADIENLSIKEKKIKDTIKQSLESLQQQQLKVDELTRKQESLLDQKISLEGELNQLSTDLQSVNQEYNKNQENLSGQLRKDYPELIKFELYLGLKIEVLDIDILRFIFCNIDPNSPEREFWVELNVKEDDFKLENTSPVLSGEIVRSLETEFNQHKEFVKFLKSTRNAFKELV